MKQESTLKVNYIRITYQHDSGHCEVSGYTGLSNSNKDHKACSQINGQQVQQEQQGEATNGETILTKPEDIINVSFKSQL